MAYPRSFDNLGARETSTVTGSAVKRLFGSSGASGNSAHRSGVHLCNHDSTLAILARLIPANASLPTISASDHDRRIQPGDSDVIPAGSGIDVCILSSSGGSPAAAYSAVEVK